jgi:ankyrin repeat protein
MVSIQSVEQLKERAEQRARADAVSLPEAQAALALEYGFPHWAKFKAYVQRVQKHGPDLQHPYHADSGYYADRAEGLLASAEDGTRSALEAFRRWDAPQTLAGARSVVARDHGFGSWLALLAHVAVLPESGEPFALAYQAVEAHDVERLTALLDRFPELAKARGTNRNDLLGMAGAAGDERLSTLLLERGANPSRGNVHGWTALHQAAYSGQPSLAALLLDAGARADVYGRGNGGTPLVVALFWGHRETAELLAKRGGPIPGNLRVAAGLGRDTMVRKLLDKDGSLLPGAGAHRGFYRPHSGFPSWKPSNRPAEVRDEALAWAARNDRAKTLELLVRRGADIDADVYRGTALTWAAATGRAESVRTLIKLGADVDKPGTFGGAGHGSGVTALHLAVQGDSVEVVQALLDAGADLEARDSLFGATPAGWAEFNGSTDILELLS